MAAFFDLRKIVEEEKKKQEAAERVLQAVQKENEARKEAAQKQDQRSRTVERNRRLADADPSYAPAGVSRSVWDALRSGNYSTAYSAPEKQQANTKKTFADDAAQRRKAYETAPKIKDLFGRERKATALDLMKRPAEENTPVDYDTVERMSQRRLAELSNQKLRTQGNPALDPSYTPKQRRSDIARIDREYAAEEAFLKQIRAERKSADNAYIDQNWDRWVELASLNRAPTDAEKKEMQQASKLLYGNFSDRMRIGFAGSQEERARLERYQMLRTLLDNKSSTAAAAMGGLADNLPGVGWGYRKLQDMTRPSENNPEYIARYGENLTKAIAGNDAFADAKDADKIAHTVGGVAGDLLTLNMVGGLTGDALKGAKWMQKLGRGVRNAVTSGATFGVERGLQALDDVQSNEQWERAQQRKAAEYAAEGQDYEKQPYSAWQQAGNVALQTGIGAIGGAAGGALSGLVGTQTARFLTKKQLQTPFMEVLRRGLSGAAFTAGDQASTYFLYPEDSRPSWEQFLQNLSVGFLYGSLSGLIGELQLTKANKAKLNQSIAKVKAKYQSTLDPNLTNEQKVAALKEIRAYNDTIRKAIASNYYAGQQKYIDEIKLGLDAVDEQVTRGLSRMGAVPNAGTGSPASVSTVPKTLNMAAPQTTDSAPAEGLYAGVAKQATPEKKMELDTDVADSADYLDKSDGSMKQQPVSAGQVTKIYIPYEGEVPVQTDTGSKKQIQVPSQAVEHAKNEIIRANSQPEAGSLRKQLKKAYDTYFDQNGGSRKIAVNGLSFKGEPYDVTLNKSAIDKVVSDKNLTVQKIALFDILDEVIQNGTYVGSGAFDETNKKKKETIRFDYFETPANILGKDYIVAFDVEVFPSSNNYKTHRVVEKMDLIPTDSTDTGPVPAAPESSSSPASTIPQPLPDVKDTAKKNTFSDVQADQYASEASRWTAQKNGDAKNIERIGDIVSYIEKKFDIPISTGNIASAFSNARGIYKGKAETIRTRVSNALPTIAHELGHHIDKQNQLRNIEYLDEIITGMDDGLKADIERKKFRAKQLLNLCGNI